MNNTIKGIIVAIVFVVCFGLVVVGQKNISLVGLGMELVGLIGLLTLLFFYNRKYK